MPSNQKVGIVVCSEGHQRELAPAIELFERFQVLHEVVVIDPNRTPEVLVEFAERASQRGLSLIIAGTGDAPALPSLIAMHTSLPVIGLPLRCLSLKSDIELYSPVNMPPRIPVATVALGDAQGAAMSALRILAVGDDILAAELEVLLSEQALSEG